jgi:hypothetical protein
MSLDKRDLEKVHVALPTLVDQMKEGKLDRREFLRVSTLLGLSASAAYALAGLTEPVEEARAATGGVVRVSMRVIKIENPPIYDSRRRDLSGSAPAGLMHWRPLARSSISTASAPKRSPASPWPLPPMSAYTPTAT